MIYIYTYKYTDVNVVLLLLLLQYRNIVVVYYQEKNRCKCCLNLQRFMRSYILREGVLFRRKWLVFYLKTNKSN